jgi:hypothetical protein
VGLFPFALRVATPFMGGPSPDRLAVLIGLGSLVLRFLVAVGLGLPAPLRFLRFFRSCFFEAPIGGRSRFRIQALAVDPFEFFTAQGVAHTQMPV